MGFTKLIMPMMILLMAFEMLDTAMPTKPYYDIRFKQVVKMEDIGDIMKSGWSFTDWEKYTTTSEPIPITEEEITEPSQTFEPQKEFTASLVTIADSRIQLSQITQTTRLNAIETTRADIKSMLDKRVNVTLIKEPAVDVMLSPELVTETTIASLYETDSEVSKEANESTKVYSKILDVLASTENPASTLSQLPVTEMSIVNASSDIVILNLIIMLLVSFILVL